MWKFTGGTYQKAARGKGLAPMPNMPGATFEGGLLAGSRVATEKGWVAVEDLVTGDKVMTFDNGPQPITCITRRLYPYGPQDAARPVIIVPTGLLGNTGPMALLPHQVVVVESDRAEAMTGDPFAPVRAASLVGLPGVRQMLPEESVSAVTFGFEYDQVVFVNGQALALCPADAMLAPATLAEAFAAEEKCRYRVLGDREAAVYVRSVTGAGLAREIPEILH